MNYRKVSPLFFVLFLIILFIPSIPRVYGSNIQFKSFCDASQPSGTTITCTLTGVSSGDAIVVSIFGVGVFNSFSTTDGQLNSYSQKVLSLTGNGAGASTYIQVTLATASGSDAVTVATGGATRIYAFTASDYSGATGFGKTGTDQQDSAGNTGTSTNVLSGTLGSSLMVDDIAIAGSAGFTLVGNNGQSVRDTPTNGGNSPCNGICKTSDSTSPTLGWSWSGGSGCGCFMSHVSLELTGVTLSQTTVTQCYGNCGTPAVTLVNTNSSHLINFNQSITLFYEFQSNLNGFLNNITISFGKSYSNSLTGYLAFYSVSNCPAGNTPFSNQCPGSATGISKAFTNPVKGKFTVSANPNTINVFNGQWLGVAISSSFSGLDLNDTNSNVNIFQTNGIMPATIQTSSQFTQCACKIGAWAWLTGNVVIGTPPPSVPSTCGNGIGDFLICLTLSFCTGTPNAGCQLAGGLFWALMYSGIGIVMIMWADHKLAGDGEDGERIIPGDVYFFVPIGVFFMFVALGALPAWVAFIIFAMVAYLFADLLLRRGRDN